MYFPSALPAWEWHYILNGGARVGWRINRCSRGIPRSEYAYRFRFRYNHWPGYSKRCSSRTNTSHRCYLTRRRMPYTIWSRICTIDSFPQPDLRAKDYHFHLFPTTISPISFCPDLRFKRLWMPWASCLQAENFQPVYLFSQKLLEIVSVRSFSYCWIYC